MSRSSISGPPPLDDPDAPASEAVIEALLDGGKVIPIPPKLAASGEAALRNRATRRIKEGMFG